MTALGRRNDESAEMRPPVRGGFLTAIWSAKPHLTAMLFGRSYGKVKRGGATCGDALQRLLPGLERPVPTSKVPECEFRTR